MYNARGFSRLVIDGSDWIFKIMYVHLLWIVFTVLGLGIFGVMPATAAVFSTIRKWLMKESDIAIFPYFLHIYRSTWKTSNIIGLVLFAMGSFIYVDLKVSQEFLKFAPIHFFLLLVLFIFIITCLFVFPALAHYELKPLQYLKQSLLLALAQPIYLLSILLWTLSAYVIYSYIPVLYIFMGATVFAFPIMWFSLRAFNKIELKKSQQA
ncbi:YesL family protein [Sporosarcina sp. YIM B06819]|uniref:YesL family protein n=1 Tax=Sporosarcina sp. YIM B06819 TaxID=3081769 RepID=UPI00298CFFAE|nr:DUF624 domain-containing protein [Sporosarcina sp. YIM B06819]